MKKKVRAVFQINIANPLAAVPWESVEVREIQLPPLKSHQVRVKTKVASINPADINYIEGEHPDSRPLPRILGLESVGEIIEIGSDVKNLSVGQHVIPLKALIGFWCDEYVSDAEEIFVIPDNIPFDQAVLFRLVPTTAWCMLHEFVKLKPGDWIIQNAANSSVGKSVVRIAKHFGWRTLNIVRRESLIPELKELGADVVITDSVPIEEQVRDYIKEGLKLLGINAVGGVGAARIARALDMHGYLVTYGAMSKRPIIIENGTIIFQDIKFVGFNYDHWMERTELKAIRSEYEKMSELFKAGLFNFPHEKIYDVEDIKEAIKHSLQPSRSGKILIKFD